MQGTFTFGVLKVGAWLYIWALTWFIFIVFTEIFIHQNYWAFNELFTDRYNVLWIFGSVFYEFEFTGFLFVDSVKWMVVNDFLCLFVSVNNYTFLFSNSLLSLFRLSGEILTRLPVLGEGCFQSLLCEIEDVFVGREGELEDLQGVRKNLFLTGLVWEVGLFKRSEFRWIVWNGVHFFLPN